MKKILIALILFITSNNIYSQSSYKEIKTTLDSVYITDQLLRKQINPIVEEYGWDSEEYKSLSTQIRKQDSINLIIVENIIINNGWLGADDIGEKGNKTLFLVIQHSSPKIWKEYLPILRKAFEDGNALGKHLALLEDRVAVFDGEMQIYGSQISIDSEGKYSLDPIINPDNVNKRRKEMGLSTIEEYLGLYGLTWNIDEHKKSSDAKMKAIREQLKYIVK